MVAVSIVRVIGGLPVASPLAPTAAASASGAVVGSRRRGRGQLLEGRLVDVGDAWRALLLGAPPILL